MYKKHDVNYLGKLLGISGKDFHRKVKSRIVKQFQKELMKSGIKNPDIGLDENKEIFLIDPTRSSNYIRTNLSIFAYKE